MTSKQSLTERLKTPYLQDLADADKKLVARYFKAAGNNESAAARNMGINRTTLRKKLDLYGLKVS